MDDRINKLWYAHTVKYSAIKRSKYWSMPPGGGALYTLCLWPHLYEVFMLGKLPESEPGWWLPGAGGTADGKQLLNGYEVSFWGWGLCFGSRQRWHLYNIVNVLNATEVFILKWLILLWEIKKIACGLHPPAHFFLWWPLRTPIKTSVKNYQSFHIVRGKPRLWEEGARWRLRVTELVPAGSEEVFQATVAARACSCVLFHFRTHPWWVYRSLIWRLKTPQWILRLLNSPASWVI